MSAKPAVFIIGNVASSNDVKLITETFQSNPDAVVYTWLDLNQREIEKKFESLNTDDQDKLEACDSVLIFYLTSEPLDGPSENLRSVKGLKGFILNNFCLVKSLKHKFKMLAIQACRGNYYNEEPYQLDILNDDEFDYMFLRKYLIAYVTCDYKQERTDDKHKNFIAELCADLKNHPTKALTDIVGDVKYSSYLDVKNCEVNF